MFKSRWQRACNGLLQKLYFSHHYGARLREKEKEKWLENIHFIANTIDDYVIVVLSISAFFALLGFALNVDILTYIGGFSMITFFVMASFELWLDKQRDFVQRKKHEN